MRVYFACLLLLIGLLAGCGASDSSVAPAVVDPLTNPDRILFVSDRAAGSG